MSHLGVVEDTFFVPMLGRIYASEHCPQIIYDKKALELKEKLPSDLQENGSQSQYTLLASAAAVCQYGSVYSVVFKAQTGRCDCPARLRTETTLLPLR